MYSPGTDSANEISGVGAAAAAIPTRFVWPHGGRRVFLTGSFTRWSEHIPMSPVEGCPTVFQVVFSLPPGSYQYKFYVDGEWRHDEHQPSVAGTYGMVNTLFLTMEHDLLSPSTPSNQPSMDVDPVSFHRAVTLADGIHPEVIHNLPEAILQVSRSRISEFLDKHTAYDLLPESGKVIALDVNLPVKQSFHILHEQGIPVAPLWDSFRGQFVGILSPLDFILILRELESHGSNLTEEELETHTISAWKEGKQQLRQLYGGTNGPWRSHQHLVHASPNDSLKDVVVMILQNEVSTIPIIHSCSEDGSFPQLLHMASLSGILRCICRYYKNSVNVLPIIQQPVWTIPFGTWAPKIGDPNGGSPLAMLTPNAPLSSALTLLVQAGVSSIPIVDDNNSLLDVYSRSDITALAKDMVYTQFRLNEMTVHQALQLGQDINSPYGHLSGPRCRMCLRTDPLITVMERLAEPGVRRVVIVEAGSKRVEGIISLGDMFKFLLCWQQ